MTSSSKVFAEFIGIFRFLSREGGRNDDKGKVFLTTFYFFSRQFAAVRGPVISLFKQPTKSFKSCKSVSQNLDLLNHNYNRATLNYTLL